MTNPEIATSDAKSAMKAGPVGSKGQVSVVTFEGRFRSKEVKVIVVETV
jgi:hypothetical protein